MKQGTILLVDDDRLVLDAMATWLREQGYEVQAAGGREAALRQLGERRFDLVLADICLADGTAGSTIPKRPSSLLQAMRRSRRASKRCEPVRSICSPSR